MLTASCGARTTTNGIDPRIKVLIGGTAVPAQGMRPIEDSVIVVIDGTIRAAGERKDVPIPQDSQRSDMSGTWILPEPGHTILAGQPADLLVLDESPVGDIRSNSPQVRRRMQAGRWIERR